MISSESFQDGTGLHLEPLEADISMESCIVKEAYIRQLVTEVQRQLKDCDLALSPRTDFDFIAKFVRVKKYDAEKAVKAIKNYYEHIHKNLRRTEGMRPSDFISVYESGYMNLFKNRARGSLVGYFDGQKWDTTKFNQREIMGFVTLLCEEAFSNKELQPYGSIAIVNLAGITFSHARKYTVPEIKYAIQLAVDGVPTRAEALHLLNPPTIFWPLHKIIMKLLPVKLKKRFHVHYGLDSLHKFLDKSILPASLGGYLDDQDAIDKELMKKLMTENKCYEAYWSPELPVYPRRMSRKRSSVVAML